MDPLTHTLVGAVTANAFLKRKVGPEAVPVLCWASNLPDIDVLVLLSSSPAAVAARRSFGHSAFLYPLWCLLLAWLFKRRYPAQRFSTLFGMCLLGASLHVFFDLVNSFGVLALWPFSGYRPELAIIFIIDLALTGILLGPFVAERLPRWKGRLRRACQVSAGLACAYVLLCAAARAQAEVLLLRQYRGVATDFSYVFPEPLGPHRWRGVVRVGAEYRIYLINAVTGRVELRSVTLTDESAPAAARARAVSPVAAELAGFFKAPVWKVSRLPDGSVEAAVYDLRFRPLVLPRRGRPFEFLFRVLPDGSVQDRGLSS